MHGSDLSYPVFLRKYSIRILTIVYVVHFGPYPFDVRVLQYVVYGDTTLLLCQAVFHREIYMSIALQLTKHNIGFKSIHGHGNKTGVSYTPLCIALVCFSFRT
jgi:hypothetical protein